MEREERDYWDAQHPEYLTSYQIMIYYRKAEKQLLYTPADRAIR